MGTWCRLQTFVSRTRLAVQRAEDMTATPFEEDNISVVPSDQGQAPGKHTQNATVSLHKMVVCLCHSFLHWHAASQPVTRIAYWLIAQQIWHLGHHAACAVTLLKLWQHKWGNGKARPCLHAQDSHSL